MAFSWSGKSCLNFSGVAGIAAPFQIVISYILHDGFDSSGQTSRGYLRKIGLACKSFCAEKKKGAEAVGEDSSALEAWRTDALKPSIFLS